MLRQHCSSDCCQRLLREQSIFSNMLSRQPWQSVWTDIVPRESLPLASFGGTETAYRNDRFGKQVEVAEDGWEFGLRQAKPTLAL
jgi:hypothetical protein